MKVKDALMKQQEKEAKEVMELFDLEVRHEQAIKDAIDVLGIEKVLYTASYYAQEKSIKDFQQSMDELFKEED